MAIVENWRFLVASRGRYCSSGIYLPKTHPKITEIMASFLALLLLTGNRYFIKPKEIEMPKVYWEKTK